MTSKLKELETLRKLFWYLVLCILAVISLYVYFVNQTVHNVALRQKSEKNIVQLTSRLGELEFKSISMKNKIDAEYAYTRGFKEVKNQKFVSKNIKGGELSLRTE